MNILLFLEFNMNYNNQYNRLTELLSISRKYEVDKKSTISSKKSIILSELIIKLIASNYLHIPYNEIVFANNLYGKPYIKNYPSFHYNISHTTTALIIAISAYPIGIDIEKIGEIKSSVMKRFFTLDEINYINKHNNLMNKRFYEIWTQKEAYVKYIGKGLSIPLKSFSIFDKKIHKKKISTFQISKYIISIYGDDSQNNSLILKIKEDTILNFFQNTLINQKNYIFYNINKFTI